MKISPIPPFLALIPVAGCSTSHYVPRDPGADDFVDAAGNMQGKYVLVYTTEGSECELDRLAVGGDTLVGIDRASNADIVLPMSHVDEIVLTSVLRGVGRGTVRGIEIGGGIGLCMGMVGAINSHDANYIGAGALSGVIVGAISGAIAGAFALRTEHFRMLSRDDSRIVKKTMPDGQRASTTITLNSWPLQGETAEQISILWDRKPVWLPKSRIKFERLAGDC